MLCLLVGCSVIDLPDKLDLGESKDKVERPVKMTALWSDTVLVEAGVVGFGGRIMFYGRNGEDPIKVDGELTVFAYDDTDNVRENTLPARKYVFRSEEFSGHYSESKLGHSYSFWIPWDRVGGPRRQVSLIARFKSKHGGVVMSEMTRHLLPGTPPADLAQGKSQPLPRVDEPQGSRVVQTANLARVGELPQASLAVAAMQTTTIAMTDGMGAAARNNVVHAWEQPSADVRVAAQALSPVTGEAVNAPPADGKLDSEQLRALVREAVQETLAANQDDQLADRFGRRRPRARIAPKLPPTRDPAPSQLPLGAPPFAPPSPLRTVSPTGSVTETNVFQGPIQRSAAPVR